MHDHTSAEAVPQGDVPSALFGHDWAKDAFELDIAPNRTGSSLRASNSLDGSSPGAVWRSVPEATPDRSCEMSPGFDEFGHAFPDEVAAAECTSILNTNRTNCLIVGAQGLTSETDILRNVRVAENAKRLVQAVPLALRMRGGKRLSTQAAALESCSTFLRFREFAESRPRLMAANFCKLHRLCPWCARRRALKLMGEHVAKTLKVMEEKQGEWLPCMMTLTVKNGQDLRERIGHLSSCLGKANRRRQNAVKQRWSEFARVEAAVWHMEVSKGKGGWHPHVHGLVMRKTAERFDVDALREEWKEITGDSIFLRVDLLHSVRHALSASIGWWKLMQTPEFKGRLVKDLCEVFKYPLKFAGLSPEDIVEVAEQSRGVRWLREWGTTFRASEPDVLSDDAVVGQLWRDHVYKWVVESLRYECSRIGEWREPEVSQW